MRMLICATIISLIATKALAADISLSATAMPYLGYGQWTGYKTYFNPGDKISMVVDHLPVGQWGIATNTKYTYKFQLALNNSYFCAFDQINSYSDTNPWGTGMMTPGCQLPADATGSGEITITVQADNIKQTASTKFYVTKDSYSDLPLPWVTFSQREWVWKNDPLGDCKGHTTIGTDGCATTSKAYLFKYLSPNWLHTPGTFNQCLSGNGGYDFFKGCFDGIPRDSVNLTCAPFDVLWENYYCDPAHSNSCNGTSSKSTAQLAEIIDQYLTAGIPVLAKTNAKGGVHYVVIMGKRETGQWNVFDPWDGQVHLLEKAPTGIRNISAIYLFSQW